MSNESDMDGSLTRASTSLKVSIPKETAKSSKRTSVIGMISAVQAEVSNPAIQVIAPVASQTVQLFQSQIENVGSNCKILTNALDDLTKIHPFVAVAVLAFKTVLKFEMTRRQNDKRIMLVQVKMNDMLSVLLILRKLGRNERSDDGKTIEERLGGRIEKIADDIEKYAAICDTFSKKKTVVKFFRSLEWEGKLESFIKLFDDHKQTLQDDLTIYSSVGIQKANETLETVSMHVESTGDKTSTLLLLQALRSPVERELIREIELSGGADKVLKDENLMKKLIEKSGDRETQGDTKVLSKDAQAALIKDIARDVNKSFSDMIQENEELFDRKFKAQQDALAEEMSTIARREGDRVIGAITSGPHDRIIDKDLYAVWKESGWKGVTKARSLVLGLREYYAERRKESASSEHQALEEIQKIVSINDEPDSKKVQDVAEVSSRGIRAEDEWALEYITISRIQPLLEAFDDDASSLVSVSEVNAFSRARPKEWSLPKWMAYWAAGFPLTLQYYFTRIQVLLARIGRLTRDLSPANNFVVDYFVNDCWPNYSLDQILAGVSTGLEGVGRDALLFERFKDYVDEEEAKMKKKLESVKYCLDAQNTLQIVIGSGRLEKSLLPLIYLLLRRAWHVLRHARTTALHPKEVINIVDSLGTVYWAACARAEQLTAICKLQNLDPREQLRKYSYGIYYYCKYTEEVGSSEYWSAIYFRSKSIGDLVTLTVDNLEYLWRHFTIFTVTYADLNNVKEDEPLEALLYPEQDLNPHVEVYDEVDVHLPSLSDGPTGRSAVWTGHFSNKQYDDTFTGRHSAGVLYLALPPEGDDGPVTGSGVDGSGNFTITGKLHGSAIIYNKEWDSSTVSTIRLSGTINSTRDEVEGVYGLMDDIDNLDAILEDSAVLGQFHHRIAPLRFPFLKPSEEALATNKAHALWRFAIDSVLNVVRIKAGRFSWPYLKDRRRTRHRFIELYNRLDENEFQGLPPRQKPLSEEESDELGSLAAQCSKQDLQLYRKLALIVRCRHSIHWGLSCDVCGGSVVGHRYLCLDCLRVDPETGKYLGTTYDTIDLCSDCSHEPASRKRDNREHLPWHALFLVRAPVARREEWDSVLELRDWLVETRVTDEKGELQTHSCHYCHETLEAQFWRCVEEDCKDNTYVCVKCKVEKDDALDRVDELSYAAFVARLEDVKSKSQGEEEKAEEKAGDDEQSDASQPSADDAERSKAAPGDSSAAGADEKADKDGGQENAADDAKAEDGNAVGDTNAEGEDKPAESSESAHRFWHNLVYYQRVPKDSAETVPATSVSDTLLSLQDRFSSFEGRLGRLEDLLNRLVALGTEAKATNDDATPS